MFNVPVLIIGFNRSDLLIELIDLIAQVKPREIYIAIDGPRPENKNDINEVEKCRRVVADIDWDCTIRTKFSDVNLGCGLAVSSAISWAFTTCENLIIIEDDIRPDLSFFRFAEEMLIRFEDDDSVQTIGAYSSLEDNNEKFSYHFSAYPEIWGWATWRSTWDKYQFDLSIVRKSSIWNTIRVNGGNILSTLTMLLSFHSVSSKRVDTWDFQLVHLSVMEQGSHIIPNVNLIQNLGFGDKATHTKFSPRLTPIASQIEFPLKHPKGHLIDKKSDRLKRKLQNRQLFWSIQQLMKFLLPKKPLEISSKCN